MSVEDRSAPFASTRARHVWVATCCAAVAVMATAVGLSCNDSGASIAARRSTPAYTDSATAETLFEVAIDNLFRLEEFNSQTMLGVIAGKLDEWIRLQKLDRAWQPDPLVASLPAEIRERPLMTSLGLLRFTGPYEPFNTAHLQECALMHAVAERTCGDRLDALARATNLFDWTVRNIQLVPQNGAGQPALHTPAQTLFFGKGTMHERAWVYMLLARQQRLPVVMLAYRTAAEPARLVPWLTAMVHETADGGTELYLFEPSLGLPVPGPDGRGVATLAQAMTDDAILRGLDLGDDQPYPVRREEIDGVVALVEASPLYLSRPMQVVESHLAGERRFVLTTAPSQLVARLQSCAHVEAAELWTMPYLTLLYQSSREGRQALAAEQARFAPAALPPEWAITNVGLQKGRLLHLKGMFAGDQGANRYYQLARPSDAAIAEGRFALPDQAANPQEEPPKAPLSDEQQQLVASYKQDASYWLGLVAYERGAYDVAVDYLQNRTIGAAPDGPWTEGAYYNLGRAYEALGRIPEAVAAYTAQVPQASPQRHGTLLRARRLRESFE